MPGAEHESEIVAQLTEIQLPLRLYVQSLLPGDPAAKDVAQHANKTIWEKRAGFEAGTNFKAWIYAIMRNLFLNQYNKQKKNPTTLDINNPEVSFNISEHPFMARAFEPPSGIR